MISIYQSATGETMMTGILCIADQASARPPRGAQGHRIVLRHSALQENILAMKQCPVFLHKGMEPIGNIIEARLNEQTHAVLIIIQIDLQQHEAMTYLQEQSHILGCGYCFADVEVDNRDEAIWEVIHCRLVRVDIKPAHELSWEEESCLIA